MRARSIAAGPDQDITGAATRARERNAPAPPIGTMALIACERHRRAGSTSCSTGAQQWARWLRLRARLVRARTRLRNRRRECDAHRSLEARATKSSLARSHSACSAAAATASLRSSLLLAARFVRASERHLRRRRAGERFARSATVRASFARTGTHEIGRHCKHTGAQRLRQRRRKHNNNGPTITNQSGGPNFAAGRRGQRLSPGASATLIARPNRTRNFGREFKFKFCSRRRRRRRPKGATGPSDR